MSFLQWDICIDKQSDGKESTKTSEDDQQKMEKEKKSCCARLPWMAKLERRLAELEKILLLKPGKDIVGIPAINSHEGDFTNLTIAVANKV